MVPIPARVECSLSIPVCGRGKARAPRTVPVRGLTLLKLKGLGGIVTKENVVREGPGRYGSEVYHGTSHLPGTKRGNIKRKLFFILFVSFLVVEHHAHSSGLIQKRRAPT